MVTDDVGTRCESNQAIDYNRKNTVEAPMTTLDGQQGWYNFFVGMTNNQHEQFIVTGLVVLLIDLAF